ncbi:hypothetical protein [Burkholderia cenocepacia]|uniref:hypothetical protein n=1 Tax=Burkholderia cenocepacia TaxID=95486 RepID=UPI0007619001|nr:hypothetical protein [Burkholderia cenocepacia]KWU17805.1 hypothetical protein AS149_13880 [Burkholderia cenocepacia]
MTALVLAAVTTFDVESAADGLSAKLELQQGRAWFGREEKWGDDARKEGIDRFVTGQGCAKEGMD